MMPAAECSRSVRGVAVAVWPLTRLVGVGGGELVVQVGEVLVLPHQPRLLGAGLVQPGHRHHVPDHVPVLAHLVREPDTVPVVGVTITMVRLPCRASNEGYAKLAKISQ